MDWLFGIAVAVVWVGGAALVAWWLDSYLRRTQYRRLMRRMKRNIEAMAAVIGSALVPAFQQAATAIADFAAEFEKLPEETKRAIREFDKESG